MSYRAVLRGDTIGGADVSGWELDSGGSAKAGAEMGDADGGGSAEFDAVGGDDEGGALAEAGAAEGDEVPLAE